ncbi:MAG: hypothetical protein KAT58_11970, partial [candidate division Zixibacteria bacterium]|nr:hypothetical protein [candidate division Zixibacteria bacterium]
IQSIIDQFILENRNPDYFLNQSIETAYQIGTGEAVTNLGNISDDYNRTIEQVLNSPAYRSRLQFIQARAFENMVGFAGDTRADLARVLGEGMASGQSPRSISRTVRERFGVAQSKAERIARTEVNMSHRRARWDESDSARDDLGVFTRQLHLSAFLPTTRVTHARRHGTLHTTADQEQWYQEDGNAINCYLPDTTVRGRFVAGSKAYYCGHIINIVTATGRNLSVTPNHPIMTHGGLVAAAELREGDDLIAYSPEVEDLAGVGDLDNDDAYTTIEHVFGSLVEVGHSSNRRVMGIDFHGDAVAMQKHIDVVDVERPLDVAVDASLPKALHDLSFVMADPILHSEGGSLALDLVGVDLPSPSFIGGACKIFSGLWTHLTGSIKACIALSPVFQTSTVEPSVKGYPGDAGLPADLQDGLPGDVVSMELGDIKQMFEGRIVAPLYIDRIVSIVRVDYSGHVYDLQEVSGLMVANGIIASNCRCSTSEVLVDSNGNPENPAFIAKVKGDGRSFFKKEDVL